MLGLIIIQSVYLKEKNKRIADFPYISMTNSFQHVHSGDCTFGLLKACDRNRTHAVSQVNSTTHCADKLPRRGRKQIQIHTDSHWIIEYLRL